MKNLNLLIGVMTLLACSTVAFSDACIVNYDNETHIYIVDGSGCVE